MNIAGVAEQQITGLAKAALLAVDPTRQVADSTRRAELSLHKIAFFTVKATPAS